MPACRTTSSSSPSTSCFPNVGYSRLSRSHTCLMVRPTVYLNALLATLNARRSLRETNSGALVSIPLSGTSHSRMSFTGRPQFTQSRSGLEDPVCHSASPCMIDATDLGMIGQPPDPSPDCNGHQDRSAYSRRPDCGGETAVCLLSVLRLTSPRALTSRNQSCGVQYIRDRKSR